MSERLGSWTRTLNEEDAVAVLLAADDGLMLAEWEAHGHEHLPQASRARRLDTLRIVRERLLDLDGDRIVRSSFLRLFQEGGPALRAGLLYGRLHAQRPWILRASGELIRPHLARADEPLPAPDAELIPPEKWTEFVANNLVEGTPAEATSKTRSTLQRNLAKLGVLVIDAQHNRETRVQHGEPEPLAFGWLLRHELDLAGRSEAPASWAGLESVAARLFSPRPGYADRCIEAAIVAGLLRRGYLAGSARLHPTEDRA